MSRERFTRERSGPPGPRQTRWSWLLLIPLVGTLIPPIYNSQDPELFGVPFFYDYTAEAGDERVEPLPATTEAEEADKGSR
jgi:hypothetical protein